MRTRFAVMRIWGAVMPIEFSVMQNWLRMMRNQVATSQSLIVAS